MVVFFFSICKDFWDSCERLTTADDNVLRVQPSYRGERPTSGWETADHANGFPEPMSRGVWGSSPRVEEEFRGTKQEAAASDIQLLPVQDPPPLLLNLEELQLQSRKASGLPEDRHEQRTAAASRNSSET